MVLVSKEEEKPEMVKERGTRFREVIVSLVYVEYVFGDMTIDEAAEEGRGQTTKGPVS